MRRTFVTLLAALVGASAMAVVPFAPPVAVGQGEPSISLSATSGRTGTSVQVQGDGCFLPDGVTGADGLLLQFVGPDGRPAGGSTLPVERDGSWSSEFTVPKVRAGTYAVRGTCIAPMYENLGILPAGTFTVTGAGATEAMEREPDTPRFPNQIEPYPAYDGQSTCSPAAKPGMAAFRDMVMAAYPGTTSYGISRDCGIGGTSEHKEGRAWDWADDATSAAGRRRVANFVRWLLRTDEFGHRHAMARRLGVMYVIWNRRIFRLYRASEGWTAYSGSSPHTDHVHVSLTRRGGNRLTSFWTMALDGPPPVNPPPPPPDPPPPPPQPPRPPRQGPTAEFSQTRRDVEGDYDHARTGDFDGDGKVDILWYGSGSKPEVLWWGRQGRAFSIDPLSVEGTFRPLSGDYDGDGRDDILWYAPGEAADSIWFGKPNRTWVVRSVDVDGRFARSLVGDFDGDGRDDIFWYGPGAAADKLSFGRLDRRLGTRVMSVEGRYRPAVGDFDGDDRDDILWFARGSAQDHVWFGRGDRAFDAAPRVATLQHEPIVADLDGNGRDDILWYAAGATQDLVWWGRGDRRFRNGGVANVSGTYRPAFAGDFDDDGDDDVFWYRSGTPIDYIWWFE